MKLVVPLLAASLLVSFVGAPALAQPDLSKVPACVGYSWCYQVSGNGFAVFCVQYKGSWVCGECEACGNEPWLP